MARGEGCAATAQAGTRSESAAQQSELTRALRQLDNYPGSFMQTHHADSMSGWKLHVYCPSTDAVKIALSRLWDDADQFGWGMKAATDRFFEHHGDGPQAGKGITIYLPHRDTAADDTKWIGRLLEGFPFAGEIAGDEMLSPCLGQRFELREDPGRDLDPREYYDWYVPSSAYLADQAARDAAYLEEERAREAAAEAFLASDGSYELVGGVDGQPSRAHGRSFPATTKLNGNPLLERFADWHGHASEHDERLEARSRYAYAIPNENALALVGRYGPLVEVGAGAGYWAALLRERGVDILAYDPAPPGAHFDAGTPRNEHTDMIRWTEIVEGNTSAAAEHPERSLFLCWPPYNQPVASKALAAYQGDTVVYIGERPAYPGDEACCTGDPAYFAHLERDFELVEEVPLPNWTGVSDTLSVWRRKPLFR